MMSTFYPLLKHSHMTFALISICGFLLRAYWSFYKPALLQLKPIKILPHINDTLLLLTALGLAFSLSLSPHNQPWLAGKILFLVFYIGFGMVALKPKYTPPIRLLAMTMALLTFISIAVMAFSKQGPW